VTARCGRPRGHKQNLQISVSYGNMRFLGKSETVIGVPVSKSKLAWLQHHILKLSEMLAVLAAASHIGRITAIY
jgi:hypothetical protein